MNPRDMVKAETMRKPILLVLVSVVLVLGGLAVFRGRSVEIPFSKEATIFSSQEQSVSQEGEALLSSHPLSGLACEHAGRRPFAVMLAGDHIARPLSGIASADLVVEMPVVTGSITRYMALFACKDSLEIGSVRSARDDFIPLAAAFDAIYVHWGGSHFALDDLRRGIIDNIDALRNPFGAFFRKSGIPKPHNGFTSLERLEYAAAKLGFRTETNFPGYPRLSEPVLGGTSGTLTIGYPSRYQVLWIYDPVTTQYRRLRGAIAEIDALDNTQASARNIVIVETTSRQIEGQYNDVRVTGRGRARVFHSGREWSGFWEKAKETLAAPLLLKDELGNDMPLLPGNLWIEIVDAYTPVTWDQ